jgi:hypothetical protein
MIASLPIYNCKLLQLGGNVFSNFYPPIAGKRVAETKYQKDGEQIYHLRGFP